MNRTPRPRGFVGRNAVHLLEGAARAAALAIARPWKVPAGSAIVVLAPHPDDETLGCGGTIALARARGVRVIVVVATDETSKEVMATRRAEARAAAAALGVADRDLVFLGFADGSLAGADDLVPRLTAVLDQAGATHVLVCSAADGHADHVALQRACSRAVEQIAAAPRMLEYVVWAWVEWPWSLAGPVHGARRLLAPWIAVRRRPGVRVRLGRHRQAKRAAVACYRSQHADAPADGAGLPPAMLRLFDRRWELLLVPPATT